MTAVTNIYFSNSGDRLVTGSNKDGAVRVWAFNAKWDRQEHFVINLSTESAGSRSNHTPKKKGKGRQRNTVKQFSTNLLNVCWSCDDMFIITLQTLPHASDGRRNGAGTDGSSVLSPNSNPKP